MAFNGLSCQQKHSSKTEMSVGMWKEERSYLNHFISEDVEKGMPVYMKRGVWLLVLPRLALLCQVLFVP